MSLSENILQKVENYLDGKMNAEETKAFENEINNNLELAELIEVNKSMKMQFSDEDWEFIEDEKDNKVINDLETVFKSGKTNASKKAIEEASQSYFNEAKSPTNRKIKLYSLFALAASIVILLGVFFNNAEQTNSEIYAEYSDWSELPSLTTRGDSDTETLVKGEQAFINKDYKTAQENFNVVVSNTTNVNPNALLYLGASQLELNKHKLALETFQKLIESNTLDSSKGYWYKTLAYLKIDDRESAIKQLEIIVSNSEYFNFKKAEKLLKLLRK